MTISVIIPAYNADRFIGQALDSVVAQTCADWEVIVVDDASGDGTAEIVNERGDDRIRLIRRLENGGPAQARHAGTRAAAGEFLCYLDADDRLTPHALETLAAALLAHPEAVLAYAECVLIGQDGRRLDGRPSVRRALRHLLDPLRRPSGDVLHRFLEGNHMVNGGVALVRRAVVEATQCWDTRLRFAEDWVAWTLLATRGPFVYVPHFTALEYRIVASGLSRTAAATRTGSGPALDFLFGDPRITGAMHATTLRRLRRISETNSSMYSAFIHVSKKEWRDSFACFEQAVALTPWRAPLLMAHYLLMMLHALRS